MVLTQLAKIRWARGMSQATLGQRAGLPQTYVSALERGLHPSSPDHVLRLASVLGVEAEALSAGEINISCNSMTNTVTVEAR